MMLEDEVELAAAVMPLRSEFVVVEHPTTCTRGTCIGHVCLEEMDAVHDAIESCYAALRD